MKRLCVYMFYKLISFLRFGSKVTIYGDPRKVRIGKNCFIAKGVTIILHGGTVEIGDSCEIHQGVILNASGGKIIIGNQSSLNPYCVVYGDGDTIIGNWVRIATQTVIVSANHRFQEKDRLIVKQGMSKIGITINDDVWIGAGVKILDGVVVEQGAVIAAGAVVTRGLPAYSICAGVPAKVLKYRN